MPKATNDASTPNVVEADAFIVRDPQGRKRILIGNRWPAESGEWFPGVALYDEHASERVCLLLGDAGPILSFAEGGNTRLELGLTYLARARTAGFVAAFDGDGALRWEVHS